jgi:hypothetical protein
MILRMRDDMLPPLTDCIPVQGASIKYVGSLEGQSGQISFFKDFLRISQKCKAAYMGPMVSNKQKKRADVLYGWSPYCAAALATLL